MNRPMSDLAEDAGEDEIDSIAMQMMAQMSLSEILAISAGNIESIHNLVPRLKEVLIREMGGKDTLENRKKLAERESAKLKACLFIPEQIKNNVHEGFDPILVVSDIIDDNFLSIFDFIMDDYQGSESEQIRTLIRKFQLLLGEVVDELKDGFENEMQDTSVFLKENIDNLVKMGVGEEMAMFSGMFTTKVMEHMSQAYVMYNQEKKRIKQ